eukprot:231109_1
MAENLPEIRVANNTQNNAIKIVEPIVRDLNKVVIVVVSESRHIPFVTKLLKKSFVIKHSHYNINHKELRDWEKKYKYLIFTNRNVQNKIEKLSLRPNNESISSSVIQFRTTKSKAIDTREMTQSTHVNVITFILNETPISSLLDVAINLKRMMNSARSLRDKYKQSVSDYRVKLSNDTHHEKAYLSIMKTIRHETDKRLISTADCTHLLNINTESLTDRDNENHFEELQRAALCIIFDRIREMKPDDPEINHIRQSIDFNRVPKTIYFANQKRFLLVLSLLKPAQLNRHNATLLMHWLCNAYASHTQHNELLVVHRVFIMEQTLTNYAIEEDYGVMFRQVINILFANMHSLLISAHGMAAVGFCLGNIFKNGGGEYINYVITERNIRHHLTQLIYLLFVSDQTKAAVYLCHRMLQSGYLIKFDDVSMKPLISFDSFVKQQVDNMTNMRLPTYLVVLIRSFTLGGCQRDVLKKRSLSKILQDVSKLCLSENGRCRVKDLLAASQVHNDNSFFSTYIAD